MYPNHYLLSRIAEQRSHAMIQEAQLDHLLSESRLEQRSWLQTLASRLGHLLIALGKRLEPAEFPEYTLARE